MRITAGEYSGRIIKAPGGTSTRPTADRVREAMFSRLDALTGGCEGAVVLDAFAGSGALGLEALSRGAASVTFVERDRSALQTLKSNIESLDAAPSTRILGGDIFRIAGGGRIPGGPFTLLFLDPPYRISKSEVRALVESLSDQSRLASGAVVVWEHGTDGPVEWPSGFDTFGSKTYGTTEVEMGVFHPLEDA